MRWSRQVLHVLRSDARSLFPFFLLHIAVLVYGVLQARGDAVVRDGLNTAPLYLYGSAMLYAALLLHRHAPDDPSAHWSSLPYDRSAVWAAKWSALAVLLAFGCGATGLAMRSLPVSAAEQLSIASGTMASLCAAVGVAALVGAAAHQLRTALLLLIALPIFATIVLTVLWYALPFESLGIWPGVLSSRFLLLIATLTAVFANLWMYRVRTLSRVSRTGVIAGAAVLYSMFTNVSYGGGELYLEPYVTTADTILAGGSLSSVRVVAIPSDEPSPPERMSLRLQMEGAPTGVRAEWMSTSGRLTKRGWSTSFDSSGPKTTLLVAPLPLPPEMKWLGATGGSRTSSGDPSSGQWTVHTALTRDAQGPRAVTASVRFSRPVVIATLPIADRARATSPGREFRIQALGGGELICEESNLAQWCGISYPARSLLRLRMRALSSWPQELEFALMNSKRKEAIRTDEQSTAQGVEMAYGMLMPAAMRITEWLLIPGTHPWFRTKSAALPIDESWLRDAELVIVEWVPVGTIPVKIGTDSTRAIPDSG